MAIAYALALSTCCRPESTSKYITVPTPVIGAPGLTSGYMLQTGDIHGLSMLWCKRFGPNMAWDHCKSSRWSMVFATVRPNCTSQIVVCLQIPILYWLAIPPCLQFSLTHPMRPLPKFNQPRISADQGASSSIIGSVPSIRSIRKKSQSADIGAM